MEKIAFNLRADAKSTTRTAWVQGGALRGPPCTLVVVVVKFAWARELNGDFTTMTDWLRGHPTLLPLKTIGNRYSKTNSRFEPSRP